MHARDTMRELAYEFLAWATWKSSQTRSIKPTRGKHTSTSSRLPSMAVAADRFGRGSAHAIDLYNCARNPLVQVVREKVRTETTGRTEEMSLHCGLERLTLQGSRVLPRTSIISPLSSRPRDHHVGPATHLLHHPSTA